MAENKMIYKSEKVEETFRLGEKIGKKTDCDQVILLSGDLGAGKTLLVQGLAEGLGIENRITSPTFNIIKEYKGRHHLFHMDLYRIDAVEELYNIGFLEYFDRPGVVVIEWPEIAMEIIPVDYLSIAIKIDESQNRKIVLTSKGEKATKLLKGLSEYADFGN